MDKRIYQLFLSTQSTSKKPSMDGGSYTGGMLLRDDVGALVRVGGRGTQKQFDKAKTNNWINYVRAYAQHNGISYAEAVIKAGPSYHERKLASPDYAKNKAKSLKYGNKKNPRPKGVQLTREGVKKIYVRAVRPSDRDAARRAVLDRARATANANRGKYSAARKSGQY